MRAFVDGIAIDLNKTQEQYVLKEKKRRERELTSFVKVFQHFKFKKDKEFKDVYSTDTIYAQIMDHGGWKDVWMVGAGVKDSGSFPGGWIYNTPKELTEELNKVFSK